MIYGSEIRRKKDLEDLHEQALKAAELNLLITKSPAVAEPRQTSKKSSNENSFADTLRAMPSDPNTPLLTPDLYEESAGSGDTNNNNAETSDMIDSDSSSSVRRDNYNNVNRQSTGKPSINTLNTTGKKAKPQGLPKSDNIVPLLPQSQPGPVFDVKDEIESIRRHVLNQTPPSSINSPDPKPVQESASPPKQQQKPQSSRSSNIVFDPVPGLFPKMFVDRFFKKRRIRVIMYGPKNSKKEFVIEGDKGDKLAKKLIDTSQSPVSNNTPVSTTA